MPANVDPIYTLTPNISFCVPVLVGAVSDGSGVIDGGGTVTLYKAFTAGSNGSYMRESRIKVGSTTGVTGPTSATNMRFYLATVGSGSPTTANSHPIAEIALPALTGSLSAPTPDFVVPWGFAIPTGMYLLCNIGVVQIANTVWQVTTIGGDY